MAILNKLSRVFLLLTVLSAGVILFSVGNVYAGSCSVNYNLDPASPAPNTNINVLLNNISTSNVLCVALYKDNEVQPCTPEGANFRCSVSSGNSGNHTLQVKYGVQELYSNSVPDCQERLTCNSTTFATSSLPAPTPTPTPASKMGVTGDCNTWNVTVPGNANNLALDFFLDRSQNSGLGIKDSVGGENGGNATYYLGGTTISGTSKSIDLRRELLNHDSQNPQSDSRNPKEVLYQGRPFKVTAYAHTPGGWAATDMVGSGVFSFPACNLDTVAPVAAYTAAPQSGCQAAVGTYNDQDYPNSIDGGAKQIDFYIMNADNQDALVTAAAKYEDGTPVAPKPAGMDGNIYLGFTKPDKNGNWTFNPNQDTLKTTDFYRTPKQYNPYNILFTDPSKPVLYKITSFAVGVNALGNRADGLTTSGVPNFNVNSGIPGNFLLSCQKPAAPKPACLDTGDFNGKGPHDPGNFDVWKDAFTKGLRGLPASISNCSGMTVDLKAFNAWRRKDLGL